MLIAQEIVNQKEAWLSGVVVFITLCIAILSFFYQKKLIAISIFFISKQQTDRLQENERFFTPFCLLFFIVKLNVISLLIYLITTHFRVHLPFEDGFQNFIYFNAITFSFFTAHALLRRLLSFVLDYEALKKFSSDWVNYSNNLIIWLLPVLIVAIYNKSEYEWVILSPLVMLMFLLLLRFVFFVINHRKDISNSTLYFILYLCTFEIIPLLFLVRLAA
jgi:hypothetical protein